MMRDMLDLLLLATALGAPVAPPSDCARDELLGPVHTVVTKIQKIQTEADGKPDTSQLLVGEETYDRNCNLVEGKQYTADFVDDEHLERVDATTLVVHSNMGDRTRHERYDASGLRVETQTTNATGQFVEHSLYTYDSHGRVIRIDSLDAAGKPDGSTTFTRDSDGHVVKQVFEFGDGRSLISIRRYEFDKRGNWIEQFDSENDPDNAAQPIRPVDILFRTITYY
jgi:YD repeat-containing protein